MTGVAVVGVGAWGVRHLAALRALLGDAGVGFVEVSPTRRVEVEALFPAVRAFKSWNEFLKSDWPAAVIAAPAARHATLAREALAAGKDVLVEKPLALRPAEAAALVREAEERGAVLMVGHILLFDPAFEKLKESLVAGALGEIKFVTAERVKLGTVRTEEDVLFSLASHDVAVALWLVDRPVTEVTATAVYARGGATADAAFLNMTFSNGVSAHVLASWLYPVVSRRFVVVGDRAMATVEHHGSSQLVFHYKGARETAAGPVVFDRGCEPAAGVCGDDALTAELKHFLACARDRSRPRADGAQGLAVVKVLAAAQKSAQGGGVPVRLEG